MLLSSIQPRDMTASADPDVPDDLTSTSLDEFVGHSTRKDERASAALVAKSMNVYEVDDAATSAASGCRTTVYTEFPCVTASSKARTATVLGGAPTARFAADVDRDHAAT